MKKLAAILVVLVLVFTAVACGAPETQSPTETTGPKATESPEK